MFHAITRNLQVNNLSAVATLEIYPVGSEFQNKPYGITIIINDPNDLLPHSVYMLASPQSAGLFCYLSETMTFRDLLNMGFEPEIISYD